MSNFISARLIPLIDIILALAGLSICCWTLSFTFQNDWDTDLKKESSHFNGLSMTSTESDVETIATRTNSAKTVVSPTVASDGSLATVHRKRMSRRYTLLLQASVAICFFASLTQIVISCFLLCTDVKKRRNRLRMWQLSHLIVLVILSMCVLVPLSYNRDKDTFRGTTSFGNYIRKEVNQLYKEVVEGGNFAHDGTRLRELLADSDLFFVVIPLSAIFIFILVLASCCVSCGCCSKPRYHHHNVY